MSCISPLLHCEDSREDVFLSFLRAFTSWLLSKKRAVNGPRGLSALGWDTGLPSCPCPGMDMSSREGRGGGGGGGGGGGEIGDVDESRTLRSVSVGRDDGPSVSGMGGMFEGKDMNPSGLWSPGTTVESFREAGVSSVCTLATCVWG